MKLENMMRGGFCIFVAAMLAGPAWAQTYLTYTFTGTGTNGVTASGSATVDANITDGYFANGSIYSQGITLTISNIPGAGPSSVTFSSADALSTSIQSTWLNVVGGSFYFGPQGEYDYLDSNRYVFLSSPTQPTFTYYETAFYYNLTQVSTITWSAAVVAVPEPSTYAVLAGMAALGCVAMRRRRAA